MDLVQHGQSGASLWPADGLPGMDWSVWRRNKQKNLDGDGVLIRTGASVRAGWKWAPSVQVQMTSRVAERAPRKYLPSIKTQLSVC